MKLATYSHKFYPLYVRTGLVLGSKILDVNLAYAGMISRGINGKESYVQPDSVAPRDMLSLIRGGAATVNALRELSDAAADETIKGPGGENVIFDISDVKLHAPLPNPLSIRDFICFQTHMKNSYTKLGRDIPRMWFEMPTYYRANPMNVIGPDEDVHWPSFTDRLDYEFEIAMYVGSPGKNVKASEASKFIFGFSIFNDISARDRQQFQMEIGLGPGKGKDFDSGKILGPYIVTAEEVDFSSMRTTIRINGKKVGEGKTSDMYWSWADLIEYVTQDESIYPGEIFGSGTVGFGSGIENDAWLKPGDTIELEADQLGVLKNKVSQRNRKTLWRGKY